MAQKQKNYKIGDLSKAFSLSKNTLRYYESRGILSPTYEYSSGYRYYDDEQIHMLGSLKKLQNMGLSVDESKVVFSGTSLKGVEESLGFTPGASATWWMTGSFTPMRTSGWTIFSPWSTFTG